MSHATLPRWAGPTFALGALVNLVFLVAAAGHVVGAHFMTTPQWAFAHQAHFWAALLLLFAAVGIHTGAPARGPLRSAAFLLTVGGTGLFLATGVVTGFLLPVIARAAPALLEADGALFNPPLAIVPVAVISFALGWFLTGLVFWKTPGLSRAGSGALMLGALLQGLPPRPFAPFPFVALQVGGALMAVAAGIIGWQLLRPPAVG